MEEADSKRVKVLEQTVANEKYQISIEKKCGFLNVLVISNGQYAKTTIHCGTNFKGALLLADEFKLQPEKAVELYNRGEHVSFNEAVKSLNPRIDDARYEQLKRDYADITNKFYPPDEWSA